MKTQETLNASQVFTQLLNDTSSREFILVLGSGDYNLGLKKRAELFDLILEYADLRCNAVLNNLSYLKVVK